MAFTGTQRVHLLVSSHLSDRSGYRGSEAPRAFVGAGGKDKAVEYRVLSADDAGPPRQYSPKPDGPLKGSTVPRDTTLTIAARTSCAQRPCPTGLRGRRTHFASNPVMIAVQHQRRTTWVALVQRGHLRLRLGTVLA